MFWDAKAANKRWKEAAQGKSGKGLSNFWEIWLLEPVCARPAASAGALLAVSGGRGSHEIFAQEVFYSSGRGQNHSIWSAGLSGIYVQQADTWFLPQILPADPLDVSDSDLAGGIVGAFFIWKRKRQRKALIPGNANQSPKAA